MVGTVALTAVLAGHALVLQNLPAPGAGAAVAPPAITARTITASATPPPPVAALRQPAAPRTLPPEPRPAPADLAVPPPARTPTVDLGTHWPADQLDRRPVPVSAPPDPGDDDALAALPLTGRPLRLRLYIDAQGRVEAVEPVDVDPFDADVLLPRLQAMFLRTAYVPGLRHGREVASVSEIEIRFEHPAPGDP